MNEQEVRLNKHILKEIHEHKKNEKMRRSYHQKNSYFF